LRDIASLAQQRPVRSEKLEVRSIGEDQEALETLSLKFCEKGGRSGRWLNREIDAAVYHIRCTP
jgi:hypothetical protein